MEIENMEIVCNVDDENQMIEECVEFLDEVIFFPLIDNSVIIDTNGEVVDIKDIKTARAVLDSLAYGFSIKSKNQESDE